MKENILNMFYHCLHPIEHMGRMNKSFAGGIADMLRRKERFSWDAVLHCPVCTIYAVWLFLRRK